MVRVSLTDKVDLLYDATTRFPRIRIFRRVSRPGVLGVMTAAQVQRFV